MPKCKKCGARLTKFDTDICPVCGEKNPLEGVSSETIEITSNLDFSDAELKTYKPRKRVVAFILFLTLGFTGIPCFYLKYTKLGIYCLIGSLILIGGIGSILAFCTSLGPVLGYVIGLLSTYAFHIFTALYTMFKPNLVDGNGEFLR